MNIWEILVLFFGFQAFLLGVLFLFKKTEGFEYANRLFALFLFLSGWLICYNALFWSRILFEKDFIHANFSYVIPLTLLAPVFFFYIRHIVKGTKISLKKDFFHFAPFAYMLISYSPYYLLNATDKLEVYKKKNIFDLITIHDYAEAVIVLIMIVYCGTIFFNFMKEYNGEKEYKLWLQAIGTSFATCVLSFVIFYILYLSRTLTTEQDYFVTLLISCSVLVASYFSFNFPDIFNGESFKEIVPFIKYKKTGLSESYANELKENLLDLMIKDKPFLDGELRLDNIANALGISRHHASQIINEHFDSNFFEFINVYRVEEAVRLIEKNRDSVNLAEIGFLSGFNNTVSFNKAFKKNTGVTPSKFRKEIISSKL